MRDAAASRVRAFDAAVARGRALNAAAARAYRQGSDPTQEDTQRRLDEIEREQSQQRDELERERYERKTDRLSSPPPWLVP
jgi:hypothetical protein